MRDLLTGLAIILIVALTTALVAPYLVDWNSQRAFLEARLSHALGQKVTIGGDIDLKLLPTPYLVLDQTVIGSDDGPLRMGIRHLDLQLSVTPLLHGEFDIIEAQLREPTLRVTLQPDRTLPALPDAPAFEANLRFDKIEVDDGTIAIADPGSGRTFVFDRLDLTADAPSLSGPFKGSGAEGQDVRTKFRVSTTAARNGRARVHLVIDETSRHAGVDLDGIVVLGHVGEGSVRPSFEGTMALASHLAGESDTPVAWRLSGPLKADPNRVDLAGGELRVGGEDAGLSLQADGQAELGDSPKLALTLKGKQLDIDRLAGAPVDAAHPAPPQLPALATLRRLGADAVPPLPLDLDLTVDSATYGGEALSDLAAHLDLGGERPHKVALSGDGPAGLHLTADGVLPPGGNGFDGAVALGADDLPAALKWLETIDPDVTAKPTDVPFAMVKAKGKIAAGPDGVAITDLALTLDRSTLAGHAHLAYAAKGRSATLAADLTATALDLDDLPDIDTLRGPSSPLDLDLTLDAAAIKVAQVGGRELDAGHLRLALQKTGRHLAITRFSADNLGGATIEGTGSLDADRATLSASVDAEKLAITAELVRRLVPGRIADAFAARAAALAPAKLNVSAAFLANAQGRLAASRLDLAGRLAATTIAAQLAPDPQQPGAVALTASADAPEGGALLAQLGFETLPLDLLGHSRLAVTAHGKRGESLDMNVDAALGAVHVSGAGRFDGSGTSGGGSGTVAMKGDDISPLLQSLALAFPDMMGRIPIDMTGGIAVATTGVALTDLQGTIDGVATKGELKWQSADADQPVLTGALDVDHLTLPGLFGLALGPPQAPAPGRTVSTLPFASGLVDPPRSALTLRARTLDLGIGRIARNAKFDLGIAPNLVSLRGLDAALDGGRIFGDATLRRAGNQATVEGKIAADGVAIGLPTLQGTLTGRLDVAGSGISAASLVSSLAGSGEAKVTDLQVAGSDPAALPKLFDAVESDELSIDEESVVRALGDRVKGPLAAGVRSVRLGLASGSLHLAAADEAVASGSVTSTLDVALDLRNAGLDETITETLQALPKGWAGAPPSIDITWSGPLMAPKRSFDVSNFLNAVAARALARETARIEAYELDIRERAFFNARLNADHRRRDDRLKAEDDARKAEAARIAAKKAAEDKATEDQAAQERAARDGASRAQPDRDAEPPKTSAPNETRRFQAPAAGAQADPSAAGRY